MEPGFSSLCTPLSVEADKIELPKIESQPSGHSSQTYPSSAGHRQQSLSSFSPCSSSGSTSPHGNGDKRSSNQGIFSDQGINNYNGFNSFIYHVPLSEYHGGNFYNQPWNYNEVFGPSYNSYGMHYNGYNSSKSLAVSNIPNTSSQGRRPQSNDNPGNMLSLQQASSHKQAFLGPSSPHNQGFQRGHHLINQVFKPLRRNANEKVTNRYLAQNSDRITPTSERSSFLPEEKLEPPNGVPHVPQDSRSSTIKKRKENEKRFPCPDCGKMFARAFNMETHHKTHSGYRPHQCPKCQKYFSRRHDLHRHMVAVHQDHRKVPLNSQVPPSPKEVSEKSED